MFLIKSVGFCEFILARLGIYEQDKIANVISLNFLLLIFGRSQHTRKMFLFLKIDRSLGTFSGIFRNYFSPSLKNLPARSSRQFGCLQALLSLQKKYKIDVKSIVKI